MPAPTLRGPRALTAAVLTAAATLGGGLAAAPPAAADGLVPTQYVAKLYTQVLGRGPDQAGWADATGYFSTNGCSQATLTTKGQQFFQSAEFTGLGYGNPEKVLVAYRAILNTDPDQGGYNANLAALNGGTPFATIIANLYGSAGFAGIVPAICNANDPGYGFGSNAAPTQPTGTTGFTGTQAQLQALINGSPANATIQIAERALIPLTSTLVVDRGITLTTAGTPGRQLYARMARFSRVVNWPAAGTTTDSPSIRLPGGGKLANVWVSGSRAQQASYVRTRWPVQLEGGTGTGITNSVVTNTDAGTSIRALGNPDHPCSANVISNNLVESYSVEYFSTLQADAISVGCEDTTVSNNQVIDATDVGIILFAGSLAAPNHSSVTGNTVLAAGHNANAAYSMDPFVNFGGSCGITGDGANVASRSFVGAAISNNLFWSASRTYYQIGLAVGTRPWWDDVAQQPCNATGGTFANNTTGTSTARAGTGIALAGLLNTTVTGNTLSVTLVTPQYNTCTVAQVGGQNGYTSGTVPAYTAGTYKDCLYWPFYRPGGV